MPNGSESFVVQLFLAISQDHVKAREHLQLPLQSLGRECFLHPRNGLISMILQNITRFTGIINMCFSAPSLYSNISLEMCSVYSQGAHLTAMYKTA